MLGVTFEPARLITEDQIVRVVCRLAKNTLVTNGQRTWWERNTNLTSTGVRHRLAEVVQLHPGSGRPCDTEE